MKPADVLMSIVPDREALIVEARVEPQFVDQIRAGQAARIRLSAFDQRTTPELDGKLMTVSADRLTDTATNQPYYALKVSIGPGRDRQARRQDPGARHAGGGFPGHRRPHDPSATS